jgi:hypothetical protein
VVGEALVADLGVGVVGVEGVAGGGPQLLEAEQLGQPPAGLGQLLTGGVEDLGHRPPARPAGEHGLL